MVGTVEERKGFGVLLDALEVLKGQQSPPLIVDAYGPYATSPDTLAAWERRGAELGLRFHGPCPPDAIQTHLLASDGLLLPSYAECQPFVLLEAMAASKPVMASQVGGVDRLLRGGAGKVIPPGEAGALAEALLRWLEHPEECRELARGGWERVRDEHSITKGMEATLSAWKNAVGVDLWKTRFAGSELKNLAASSLTNQT